jgi:8-oxo-dGTP pyrophosphatase MutT (NUDIX family)
MKQKVVAYITRRTDRIQLLVFEHRDFPEAGLQVPAGTVEPGEDPVAALHREIYEESGLRDLRLIRKLGESEERQWDCYRRYYWLNAPMQTREQWSWTTNDFHDEAHRARNAPLVFSFHWTDLTHATALAGNQHRLLHRVLESDGEY